MWVFVLTVQGGIKVLTASCECLYWLFRIVLRCWQFHESSCIDCSGLYYSVDSFMRVLVLTVQDCIKVVRVSCECLYWLFRVVLRCWQLHVSVFIDCSWLYWGVDSFMWVLVLTVQGCIKVLTASCECLNWLFRVALRCWQLHVSVFIDCSWLYWGVDSFMWVLVLTVQGYIKVLTASCECLNWLFRVVLRSWQLHVSTCINCSGLY